MGITNIITSRRNGSVIYSSGACNDCDVLMMTARGTIIRTKIRDIKISGRNTQGVTLMRTEDKVISVAIAKGEGDSDDEETVGEGGQS
jgi:DNA gyrase subunit A